MRAVAINGSPRPGGNTENLLKKVLEPLETAGWSTEYRQIGIQAVSEKVVNYESKRFKQTCFQSMFDNQT